MTEKPAVRMLCRLRMSEREVLLLGRDEIHESRVASRALTSQHLDQLCNCDVGLSEGRDEVTEWRRHRFMEVRKTNRAGILDCACKTLRVVGKTVRPTDRESIARSEAETDEIIDAAERVPVGSCSIGENRPMVQHACPVRAERFSTVKFTQIYIEGA